MTENEILTILLQFKTEHAQEFCIQEIGVFGSFARGEANENSDIDIVFQTNQPNLFRTASMKVELEKSLGRHVDVVRLRDSMNPRLKQRILKEAKFV